MPPRPPAGGGLRRATLPRPGSRGAPLPPAGGGVRGGLAPPHAPDAALIGQIGGSAYAVAVQGHCAYIGVGPRLVIVDISNPAQPVAVGRTRVLPSIVGDIALAGSYAYIADGYTGLRILSISDPANPYEVGFYATPAFASGVAVAGAYAYVPDRGGGLDIVWTMLGEVHSLYLPLVRRGS
ncbi:MAG: hypothetical protein C4311_14815 [Chloroflexota bacterium]